MVTILVQICESGGVGRISQSSEKDTVQEVADDNSKPSLKQRFYVAVKLCSVV